MNPSVKDKQKEPRKWFFLLWETSSLIQLRLCQASGIFSCEELFGSLLLDEDAESLKRKQRNAQTVQVWGQGALSWD